MQKLTNPFVFITIVAVSLTLWDIPAQGYQITQVTLFSPEALENDATVGPGAPIEVHISIATDDTARTSSLDRLKIFASRNDSGTSAQELVSARSSTFAPIPPRSTSTYFYQFFAPLGQGSYSIIPCIDLWYYTGPCQSHRVAKFNVGSNSGVNLKVSNVHALLSTSAWRDAHTPRRTSTGFWQTKYINTTTSFYATVTNDSVREAAPTIATLYRVRWFGRVSGDITWWHSNLTANETLLDHQNVKQLSSGQSAPVVFDDILIPKEVGYYIHFVRILPISGESDIGDNFSGYWFTRAGGDRSVIQRVPSSYDVADRYDFDRRHAFLAVEETPDLTIPWMYVTNIGRSHEYVLPNQCTRLYFSIANIGLGLEREDSGVVSYLLSQQHNGPHWYTLRNQNSGNCYGGLTINPNIRRIPFYSGGDDQFPVGEISPGGGETYDFWIRPVTYGRHQFRIALSAEQHTENDPINNFGPIVTIEVVPELPDLAVTGVDILGQQADVVKVTPNTRVTVRAIVENRASRLAPVPPYLNLSLASTGSASGPVSERAERTVPHSGQSHSVFLEAVTPSRIGSNVAWSFCATSPTSETISTNNCDLVRLSVIDTDDVAPSPPILLSAEGGRSRVVLTWLPPLINGGSRIDAFAVENALPGSKDWSTLTTISSLQTSHTYNHVQRNLQDGQAMQYRVVAMNQAGMGEPSNVISAATSALYSANLFADLNRDGIVNEIDALILSHSHLMRQQLGDGTSGGFPYLRQIILQPLLAEDVLHPDDSDYRHLIRWSNENRTVGGQPALDINGSGTVDSNDARIMYFAISFPELVGDGYAGGFEQYRRILLGPHSIDSNANDVTWMALIRRANEVRTLTYGSN